MINSSSVLAETSLPRNFRRLPKLQQNYWRIFTLLTRLRKVAESKTSLSERKRKLITLTCLKQSKISVEDLMGPSLYPTLFTILESIDAIESVIRSLVCWRIGQR